MNVEIKDSSSNLLIENNIEEAKSNAITLHNISPKYSIENILFDGPRNVIQKFDEIIFNNRVILPVQQRYRYAPEKFAKSYYGSSDLWWLVLYSARMKSYAEMCTDKIEIMDVAVLPKLQNIIQSSEKELSGVTPIEDLTLYNLKM